MIGKWDVNFIRLNTLHAGRNWGRWGKKDLL